MKKLVLSLSLFLTSALSIAQVGVVAPDFTQTDLSGTTHNLYTYLNAGKVVIVDMSATWCGPCWNFHNGHYLESLYDEFGPNGTNEVVILFYEDDVQTTLADLNGTGGSTQGDWVTGVPYPIINGTQSLPYPEYGEGYPTISVICPADKKIKENLFDYNSLSAMQAAVQDVIDACVLSTASLSENSIIKAIVSPNPTTGATSIRFSASASETGTVGLFSVSGQLIATYNHTLTDGTNTIELDLSSVEAGTYFIQVKGNSAASGMIPVIKE